MMSEDLDIAKRYRQRAEELRIIATDDRTGENRAALERIARDYDRMAETMETLDRTNAARRKEGTSD
jgi:hypothetical protein